MRSNIEGNVISNSLLKDGIRFGDCLILSTGTAIALTAQHPPLIRLNLTGATAVKLPAASSSIRGLGFEILNESTGALAGTLQTSTGGTLNFTNAIINQYGSARVRCNGSSWFGVGGSTA